MHLTLERKAFGWSLLAVLLAVGGAGLLAGTIKMVAGASGMASADWTLSTIAPTPELAARGEGFYEMSCSHCHGDDATGDEGPDLHNLSISNAHIARTIKKGIKDKMPTFAKKYNDAQIAALVSYLRTLR
jgi:mono/diheme cytochrome c family protein